MSQSKRAQLLGQAAVGNSMVLQPLCRDGNNSFEATFLETSQLVQLVKKETAHSQHEDGTYNDNATSVWPKSLLTLMKPSMSDHGYLNGSFCDAYDNQVRTSNHLRTNSGANNVIATSTSIANGGPDQGRWVHNPEKPFDSPDCCGSDDSHFLKSTSSKCGFQEMSRVRNGYDGRTKFLAHVGQHSCVCTTYDPWRWESASLPRFNSNTLCSLLGKRNMVFIGDSTLAQTASTMMNAVFKAGCQTQMFYRPGATLGVKQSTASHRGLKWTDYVDGTDGLVAEIVILSMGAHVHGELTPFDNEFDDIFEHVLQTILVYRQTHPHVHVIWKTQNPAGCTSELSDGVNYAGNTTYNWHLMRARDERVLVRLQQHGLPFLDMRMLYNRTDAHVGDMAERRDCMHYCIPGALDIVPSCIQQVLLKLDSSKR
eukprot:m.278678 g.278678  ORF g.278678 m.278678 type:complete len:426 (-) comp137854_c0_seq1:109-1386(-)